MNNDLEYVESDYNEQKNQVPWLKIGMIIAGIIVLIVIIILLLKGCSNKEYTVTFDSSGGTSIGEQIVKRGDTIIKPSNPTRIGYEFIGWYYNDKIFDFKTEIKDDLTLVAKWEEIIIEEIYTVTFDTDGGTIIESQQVEVNKTVIRPTDPVKEGYVFQGWYIDETSEFDFTTRITMDIILTAKWKSNNSSGGTTTSTKYTVTFNSNGGSRVSSQIVTKGGKATKPANPTRKNYEFQGWYLNNKEYDFNSNISSNITLVANWKETEKYTVTFDSNGGSRVSSQTVYKNDTAIKPTNPTKDGYVFTGWTLNGSSYNFSTQITKNITLVANWKAEEVNASFNFKINSYSEIGIINVNMPTNYKIQYKKGNVIASEVISNGTNITDSKKISINGDGVYTFVASVDQKEILTKKIYVQSAYESRDLVLGSHAYEVGEITQVVGSPLTLSANATASVKDSKLVINLTDITENKDYYCPDGFELKGGKCEPTLGETYTDTGNLRWDCINFSQVGVIWSTHLWPGCKTGYVAQGVPDWPTNATFECNFENEYKSTDTIRDFSFTCVLEDDYDDTPWEVVYYNYVVLVEIK